MKNGFDWSLSFNPYRVEGRIVHVPCDFHDTLFVFRADEEDKLALLRVGLNGMGKEGFALKQDEGFGNSVACLDEAVALAADGEDNGHVLSLYSLSIGGRIIVIGLPLLSSRPS